MKSLLPWSEAEEITFECEPGTLKEEKLAALREIGITRLSLGVENFDARILEVNGRAHRAEEIYRAYRYAREVGFPQINIDLIAGMVDETEENWQRNIRETLSLAPDSVTIYQMEVPYNTTIFKEMKETGKLSAPVADWATKRRWVSEAFAAFEEAGYTVTSAYTAVRNPEQTRFIYRDRLWTGADLVGLGVASFSHVGGVHFQNLTEFGQYLEAVENSQFPIHRAFETDAEERMIRELILQLKLGRVSQSYFLNKFGISLSEKFGEQIAFLKSRGLMNELADGSGDWLTLDRQALLKVDVIVHAFFLPRHRSPRYT
jgi:oxygen-independent coproporphyrinogen-3 oxidase